MNRPSPARIHLRLARCATRTKIAPQPRRVRAANPDKLAYMAKRKRAQQPKVQRRPREEIDRNYYFGDVLIKTGVAVGVVLAIIAFVTPFSLMGAIRDGMWDYLAVVGTFGVLGLAAFLTGRHLRRNATHWDFD